MRCVGCATEEHTAARYGREQKRAEVDALDVVEADLCEEGGHAAPAAEVHHRPATAADEPGVQRIQPVAADRRDLEDDAAPAGCEDAGQLAAKPVGHVIIQPPHEVER